MKKMLVCLFAFIPVVVMSQSRTIDENRIELVKDFLHDLYVKPVTPEQLANKYIYFQPVTDTTIRHSHRVGGVGYVAEYFRKSHGDKYDKGKVLVLPYKKLKGMPMIKFHPDIHKNIYGVVLNSEVIMYVSFEKDRIASVFPYKVTQNGYASLLAF